MPSPPNLETSLSYCTYCPKLCRHTCPVSNAEARETLTPRDKMATIAAPAARRSAAHRRETEPLYGCTGCGACTDFCLHKVEPGARSSAAAPRPSATAAAIPALHDLARALPRALDERRREGARASAPEAQRPSRRRSPSSPAATRRELAPTHARAVRAHRRRIRRASPTASTAAAAIRSSPPATSTPSASTPSAWRGQLAGYARVVVNCPSCVWAMRTQYRAFGVPLAADDRAHQRVPRGLRRAAADRQEARRRVLQDPCYLGRRRRLRCAAPPGR